MNHQPLEALVNGAATALGVRDVQQPRTLADAFLYAAGACCVAAGFAFASRTDHRRRSHNQASPPIAPHAQNARMQQAAVVLGVPPTASPVAIQAAFRTAMRTAHPDVGGSAALARMLIESREVLLANARRRAP